jgi:5-methylthioadenosine/S-adenosylhomocysteine deaminase
VVELGKLHSAPRYHYSADAVYSHLVYGARSADVRDVLVDGRMLVRDRALLTLDEDQIIAQAQAISARIDAFLATREGNLMAKIFALGGVQQDEIFEIQAKVRLGPGGEGRVQQILGDPNISITKISARTQYDTYFLFRNRERLRIREDHRTDPGARPEPKYTVTLMAEARRGDFPHDIVLSRARYTAPADHTVRFYREYFQPDKVVELEKRRRRWRIIYKEHDFAVNLDTLLGGGDAGPFLEIKSRTWSSRDAADRASLIGELLTLIGATENDLMKQEYVEME